MKVFIFLHLFMVLSLSASSQNFLLSSVDSLKRLHLFMEGFGEQDEELFYLYDEFHFVNRSTDTLVINNVHGVQEWKISYNSLIPPDDTLRVEVSRAVYKPSCGIDVYAANFIMSCRLCSPFMMTTKNILVGGKADFVLVDENVSGSAEVYNPNLKLSTVLNFKEGQPREMGKTLNEERIGTWALWNEYGIETEKLFNIPVFLEAGYKNQSIPIETLLAVAQNSVYTPGLFQYESSDPKYICLLKPDTKKLVCRSDNRSGEYKLIKTPLNLSSISISTSLPEDLVIPAGNELLFLDSPLTYVLKPDFRVVGTKSEFESLLNQDYGDFLDFGVWSHPDVHHYEININVSGDHLQRILSSLENKDYVYNIGLAYKHPHIDHNLLLTGKVTVQISANEHRKDFLNDFNDLGFQLEKELNWGTPNIFLLNYNETMGTDFVQACRDLNKLHYVWYINPDIAGQVIELNE